MLKPAICYKEAIENALKEYFYSDDMMFYQGCVNSYLIQIEDCGMVMEFISMPYWVQMVNWQAI